MGETLFQLLSRTEFIRRKFFPYTYLSRTPKVVEGADFDPLFGQHEPRTVGREGRRVYRTRAKKIEAGEKKSCGSI
jgi:hypothetical protein